MGCGASAGPTPLDKTKSDAMCQDACVRMQVACIWAAFEKPDQLKIDPPPEVKQLKDAADALKAQADKLGESEAPKEGGGMIGGMMNMAAGAVKSAASAGLGASAAGLTVLTDQVEAPFNSVAQDVVAKKKADLYNTCVTFINAFKFQESTKLARGSIDGTGYAATKADGISTTLATLAGQSLCDKLLPGVTEAIKDHLVTTAWDKAQKAYMAAYEMMIKVMKPEDLAKVGVTPIKCDLNAYITLKIWEAIAKLMAEEEKVIRGLGDGAKGVKDKTPPLKPKSFDAVFSSNPLMSTDYSAWETEGK